MEEFGRVRSWSALDGEETLKYTDNSPKGAEMIHERLAQAGEEQDQCLQVLLPTEEGRQVCRQRSDADSRQR